MQCRNQKLDIQAGVRQTVGQAKRKSKREGRNYQIVPGKEHLGVRGKKKWDERDVEGKKDEEWLKPKWQRLHPHHPSRILVYPPPCCYSTSLFPYPHPSLSLSLFCSQADLLRQRGEEFRRFKGCSVKTACHVGATAALPTDFTDSCCYNWSSTSSFLVVAFRWSQTAAKADSGAVCLIHSPSKLDMNLMLLKKTRTFGTSRSSSKTI